MTQSTAETRTVPDTRTVRVEVPVLDRIAEAAVRNRRSLSQEVTHRLERSLASDDD